MSNEKTQIINDKIKKLETELETLKKEKELIEQETIVYDNGTVTVSERKPDRGYDAGTLVIRQKDRQNKEEVIIPLDGNGWFKFKDSSDKTYHVYSCGDVDKNYPGDDE